MSKSVYKDLYGEPLGGKSWSFLFSAAVAIAPLIWDIWLKIHRLRNFNMLF